MTNSNVAGEAVGAGLGPAGRGKEVLSSRCYKKSSFVHLTLGIELFHFLAIAIGLF